MISPLKLIVLVTSAAAALLPRDFSQTSNDLRTIDSDVQKLTSAIRTWDGTLSGLSPITAAEQQLETDLKRGANDSQGCTVYTSTDATTTINYMNGTLAPDVEKMLDTYVASKGKFTSAGAKQIPQNEIADLKSLFDKFFSALGPCIPSARQSQYKSVVKRVDDDFQRAEDSYSGTGTSTGIGVGVIPTIWF